MSTLRKLVVPIAALFLTMTGMVLAAGTAGADCDWNIMQCGIAD